MNTAEILTVETLLVQIQTAAEAVQAVIEGCSQEQWQLVVANEERSIGIVCHHIAFAYPLIADWACHLARGEALPSITFDDVHALNHQHAENAAFVDAATTLALLQTNTVAVKERLDRLSDSSLQQTAPFPLIGGQDISVQQIVQQFLIDHTYEHLDAIRKTIEQNVGVFA